VKVFWDYEAMRRWDIAPAVLAIGDSWLWYPWGNLAQSLSTLAGQGQAVLVLGGNGWRVKDVCDKKHLAKQIILTFGGLRAIVVSIGGNDLAGGNLKKMLKADCSDATTVWGCLKPEFNDYVWDVADDVMATTREYRNATLDHPDPACPVVVHGYDFPSATRRGWFGQGKTLSGPLDDCRVPERLRDPLLRRIIDHYNGALITSVAKPDFNFGIHHADLRGTTKQGEWLDELHPTAWQFTRMGRKIVRMTHKIASRCR
jgi:hypothetical protein